MFSMKDSELSGENTVKLDLTNYATKDKVPTLDQFNILTSTVAGKLDSSPQHKHDIIDINELTQALSNKLSNQTKYSYETLLNDSEKIPYLENVKIPILNITKDKLSDGYIFRVDSQTGDLIIMLNTGASIASYNKASGHWIFNGVDLNNFITTTREVLTNHYQAICLLASKFGIVDSSNLDGDKFTEGVVIPPLTPE